MVLDKSLYLKWLRAAYIYYITPGEIYPTMTDTMWDQISKEFYQNRDKLSKEEFPVIHRDEFTGGSIFWLKRHEYPEEVKHV